MAITPRGMSITEAYRNYRDNLFLVNRTYQRKLVWTLDEKEKLIDSILKQYPIPLILLAQMESGEFEIIDGMQRLNAIFNFIENQYPLRDGRFFDIEQSARAKQALTQGIFKIDKDVPKLTEAECANVVDYQLAVTIFSVTEESNVTDIFGRINSGGKQLSEQEQRQAGIVSPFASFVRRLSSELRGDASKDLLNLSEMPVISVDPPTAKLGYGIRADDTFWCRQGILRAGELRDSLDEQVVADIAISILRDEPFGVSREKLDEAYDSNSDFHRDLNNRLITYPETRLSQEIKTTFSTLTETVEEFDAKPNVFRKVVAPKAGSNPVRTPFYAVFMAFFDLVIRKNKKPENANEIFSALKNIAPKLKSASHHSSTADRKRNIGIILGLIQDHFVDVDPPLLRHGQGLALDFENSLRRSAIETPRYEFKQGFLRLSATREKDSDLVQKLGETACAIANIGPDVEGFIFIGVADKDADATRIEAIDGVTPIEISDKKVVGIDREARFLGISIEEYVRKFVSELRGTDLSDPLKSNLLPMVDTVTFKGLNIIRITVPKQKEMSWVGDKTFQREGSETREAFGKVIATIQQRFS